MARSRHQGRGGMFAGVAVMAICAALVAAGSANAANLSEWTGSLPAQDGSSWVDFKVKSKKNKQTKKFRPVAIKKVSVAFLEMNCTDNQPTQTSFTWGQLKLSGGLPEQIPVRDRKFSFSHSGGYETADGSVTFTFTFSGRVPRNGPPTGTLRYKTTFPRFTADPVNPDAPGTYVQVSCDTGPLSWTGQRLQEGTL